MPELPEVEIVTQSLRSLVKGRVIERAALYRERLAPSISPTAWESTFSGTRIEAGNINFFQKGKSSPSVGHFKA